MRLSNNICFSNSRYWQGEKVIYQKGGKSNEPCKYEKQLCQLHISEWDLLLPLKMGCWSHLPNGNGFWLSGLTEDLWDGFNVWAWAMMHWNNSRRSTCLWVLLRCQFSLSWNKGQDGFFQLNITSQVLAVRVAGQIQSILNGELAHFYSLAHINSSYLTVMQN